MRVYLGLGTNLGDKESNLHVAVRKINERADDGRVPSGRRKTSASVRKMFFRFSDGKMLKNQMIFEHSDRKIEPDRKKPTNYYL